MRQDILDAIKTFNNDTLLDIAVTFGFIDIYELKQFSDEELESMNDKILPEKARKSYIRKRALADENIAEYVLLNA